ncbi:transcription termination factor NusA [Spiroplasma endosymbiont of Amphibalanus improvisus]|uniref:transcription termination factor NusA n=1 Tax=Spiroplasma endosymbiont of Amphibalanus improvisus TaxID=3066327 RepID=UPI00313CA889
MATKKTVTKGPSLEEINILELADTLSQEKQIDKDKVVEAVVDGIKKVYEKKFDPDAELEIIFNELGGLRVFKKLLVVEKVEDEYGEISLEQAIEKFDPEAKVGNHVLEQINSKEFNRLIINSAVQIIKQNLREAEKDSVIEKYSPMIGQLMYGEVVSLERRFEEEYWLIKVDRTFATLKKINAIPGDRFHTGDRIAFHVEDVVKSKDIGQIQATRKSNLFLEKIMEIEIPEVLEGVIKIKSIVRNPGVRSKVAVMSTDSNVDPIGACVGNKGSRIVSISNQLNNERIDVCAWEEDKQTFIINALSPVKTISINKLEMENKDNLEISTNELGKDNYDYPHYDVVVPDEQYSLSIGKRGMSIWLVSQLTKSKLNIVSYKDALEKGMTIHWNGNVQENELDMINLNARSRKNRNNKE